jgi:hypothetical protein
VQLPESSGSLARDFARAIDPASLFMDGGFTPDKWQRDALESTADRELWLCSRQAGKSTTVAGLALHQSMFDPGLSLLIAPSLRQSSELFRKVKDIHSRLTVKPDIAQESALRLELRNGARIIALPGADGTIRGYSAAKLIVIDEAARVSEELFAAVRPMLATTRGRMILLSTPYGRRGFFFDAWENGLGWKRTKITAEQCPRIDPAWLAEERRLMGEWQFRQEYLCEFVDTDEQLFSSAIIEAALTSEVKPLWGN